MSNDKNSKKISIPGEIGTLLAMIGGGLVVGSLISAGIWMMMTGRSITSMAVEMSNPKYYYALMVMQLISTIFIFFIPSYFFAKICYGKPMEYLGLKRSFNFQQALLVIGILGLTFLFSNTVSELTKMIPLPETMKLKFENMEKARELQEKALININTLEKYILSMIVIALAPGIVEETFFRGALQKSMIRWFKSPWAGIILSSFIFSLVHISYYGFFVRFGLGIFLGLVFYYTGSLWLSILFHFLFNGVQVSALYFSSHSEKPPVDVTEQNLPIWLGILALAIIIFALVRLKKVSAHIHDPFVYEEPADPNDFNNWIARNS